MSNHRGRWRGRLEYGGRPPRVAAEEEPPVRSGEREKRWTADHDPSTRDMTPALGRPGGPARWREAVRGASVALARPSFGDARWSFLFRSGETNYSAREPPGEEVPQAARRMRESVAAEPVGPIIKPPVWTWEVPLYFWVGGVASGAAFVAAGCDLAGDHRSAVVARRLALGAASLAPPLLIADLGRPGRFLNMLRIFKPRSPMNTGAWCLVAFSASATAAVAGDLLGRPRAARSLGALTSFLGTYLGSYTGVLLATTAVPLWARSRTLLGPIFICTATASGAAATRLILVARGLPEGHPTRRALGDVETASIATELVLAQLNHRRLGEVGKVMSRGRAGVLFRSAEVAVAAGVSTRVLGRRYGRWVHDLASVLYLAGALVFRFAWVQAGRASALEHRHVAAMARGRESWEEPRREVPKGDALPSLARRPLPELPGSHLWSEAVRRTSLLVERLLPV